MIHVSDEEFEEMVQEAVERIPKRFADHLDNLSFMAADEATPQQMRQNRVRGMLLGLYEGIPLPAATTATTACCRILSRCLSGRTS